ncbi:sulfotransferase [Hoeflea sp. CAU 1731]
MVQFLERIRQKKSTGRGMSGRPVQAGPDFLCVGAQKGGTTWFFDQLEHHPDFWMPPVKELHYFNTQFRIHNAERLYKEATNGLRKLNRTLKKWNKRPLEQSDIEWLKAFIEQDGDPVDFDRYRQLFSPKENRLSGDVTPNYAILPDETVSTICRELPEVKIIYFARDPIERIWSQYCMVVDMLKWEAPEQFDTFLKFADQFESREHSRAAANAGRWKDYSGSSRFGLYFFDDIQSDADEVRRRVIAFVGGDPARKSGNLGGSFNRKSKNPKIAMTEDIREHLVDTLGAEVIAAARELGGPAEAWPARYGL